MNKDEKPKGSWWLTLPGTLTGLAGVLTAVAGLLVALNQTGFFGHKENPASPSLASSSDALKRPNEATPSAAPATTATMPRAEHESDAIKPGTKDSALRRLISFPSGTEVTLTNQRAEGTYKILAAQVSPKSTGKLSLKFSIRLTNLGRSDLGFGNDSFRLQVDGVPRAPTSYLNELVEAKSAKEADVSFEIPDTAQTLALTVDSGQEAGSIPIILKTAP